MSGRFLMMFCLFLVVFFDLSLFCFLGFGLGDFDLFLLSKMRKNRRSSLQGALGVKGVLKDEKKQSSSDGTRKAYKGLLLNLIKAY